MTRALLVAPRFMGQSFSSFQETCELGGARCPAPPLGLLTVAALLPSSWECRLVNRSAEELRDADVDWADLVMTGGMLPQQPDTLRVIELAHARGKPVVVGGPDATSTPDIYAAADYRVLGEAEGVIGEFIAAWESGLSGGIFEAERYTVDVTKTPLPRFDLVDRRHYVGFSVQFSRGCPFTCEFCDIIELYGRVPRVKTAPQVLAELDALHRIGHRGPIDFVDDNFIGNKKAVKAFLPDLIAWQKAHGYPFQFTTEASINLADDEALLALMRAANFVMIFVGIESPDTDTLVSMQKKQNTRRVLADLVHKIYRWGIVVNAGFILGFDTERGPVAETMIHCIEATSIPYCMVGLLYALPGTQLSRRLMVEGRLKSSDFVLPQDTEIGIGDQCTAGLNFMTIRPRREILADYSAVLASIYHPRAYFARVRTVARMLRIPAHDRSASQDPPPRRLFTVPVHDLVLLWRLVRRVAIREPRALWPFLKAFGECARRNPRALAAVCTLAAFYLHVGQFARFVRSVADRQIAELDAIGAPPEPAEEPRPRVQVA
jgi:radical SAM superfamily enzyme YgiQ (UPF0313 family)